MSKMVEKVAEAVREANDGEGEAYLYSQFYTVRERSIQLARAAIEAMRVPTPEMLHAAFGVGDGVDADENNRNRWQAMINAALQEASNERG